MTGEPTEFYSWGTRCAAVLWQPRERARGPAPAVVLCHGFRGIKEWFLPEFAVEFAARGYAVLTFDYRGFGESEGERGRLVPDEQVEDIRAAVAFLGTRPGVDPGRIAVYGTSFGGANAVAAAARDQAIRCVVCQVGIGDVRRAWPETYDRFAERLAADRVERAATGVSATIDPGEVLDNPQSNAAFREAEARFPQLRQRFPFAAVERIFEFRPEGVVAQIAPRAVMFIGATADDAVPVEETTHLYRAAGEPKALEIFDITHYEIYQSPHREHAVDLAVRVVRAPHDRRIGAPAAKTNEELSRCRALTSPPRPRSWPPFGTRLAPGAGTRSLSGTSPRTA